MRFAKLAKLLMLLLVRLVKIPLAQISQKLLVFLGKKLDLLGERTQSHLQALLLFEQLSLVTADVVLLLFLYLISHLAKCTAEICVPMAIVRRVLQRGFVTSSSRMLFRASVGTSPCAAHR